MRLDIFVGKPHLFSPASTAEVMHNRLWIVASTDVIAPLVKTTLHADVGVAITEHVPESKPQNTDLVVIARRKIRPSNSYNPPIGRTAREKCGRQEIGICRFPHDEHDI